MFKFIVVILLVLIALYVADIANNQSLTEQDKHQVFVQKQEAERQYNEKLKAKEQEKRQKEAETDALRIKTFSEVKGEDKAQWLLLKAEKPMLFLIVIFFGLMLVQKFRQNVP